MWSKNPPVMLHNNTSSIQRCAFTSNGFYTSFFGQCVWTKLMNEWVYEWMNESINQSTFVKRHKSRANRRRVRKKARPSGYRKVPSLKHVWKWSQFWVIDNYMAVSSTLKASWDWKNAWMNEWMNGRVNNSRQQWISWQNLCTVQWTF